MFSDAVESAELQQLRLCLRDLRDISQVREEVAENIKAFDGIILFWWALMLLCALITVIQSLEITSAIAFPLVGLLCISIFYGFYTAALFIQTLRGFSLDAWHAQIEASRELFTKILPQGLGVALLISAACGLFAGELSSALAVLALSGVMFGVGFVLACAVFIGICAIALCVVAGAEVVRYVTDIIQPNTQEEVSAVDIAVATSEGNLEATLNDDVEEETGLTPI